MSNSDKAQQLRIMQTEIVPWCLKNYGDETPEEPLLGMVEEWGEACEVMGDKDPIKYLDAVSDLMIYLVHFCDRMNLDPGTIYDARDLYEVPSRPMPILLGRIAHAYVKGYVQQYRGAQEKHHHTIVASLGAIMRYLDEQLQSMGQPDLVTITGATWELVKLRDWTKDRKPPTRAHERNRQLAHRLVDARQAASEARVLLHTARNLITFLSNKASEPLNERFKLEIGAWKQAEADLTTTLVKVTQPDTSDHPDPAKAGKSSPPPTNHT